MKHEAIEGIFLTKGGIHRPAVFVSRGLYFIGFTVSDSEQDSFGIAYCTIWLYLAVK